MELKLAVISDLHCHHSSTASGDSLLLTDWPRRPSVLHPVSAFQDLVQKLSLRADIVLMPGDLANKADPQGLNSGWDYMQEITKALGTNLLIPTLGNHDVSSRAPGDDPFRFAKGLYPEFPGLGSDNVLQFWAKHYCVVEQENFRVLVINSAFSHNNPESAKRGLISNQQLQDIETYLNSAGRKTFQIALCHHHPILHEDISLGTGDVMENGSLLIELLSKHNFSLVVHGHKHHPKLSYAHGGAGHLPVLASGSFSAGMKNGLATRTRNVFHLLTLNAHKEMGILGKVETWQFQFAKGWTPASYDAADFPSVTGFGCYKSAKQVADEILNEYQAAHKSIVPWVEIVEKIPELQFVPPALLKAVAELLQASNISFSPPAPDFPKVIGGL